MNIFVTYADPVVCAEVLDNQRLVKMMTESVQIMCTALQNQGAPWQPWMTRSTHEGHPVVLWAQACQDNFLWLWEHTLALEAEWKWRYDHYKKRRHARIGPCDKAKIWTYALKLPPGSSPFANCAANQSLGLDFRHIKDVHLAYRLYLSARWALQVDLNKMPASCRLPRSYFC